MSCYIIFNPAGNMDMNSDWTAVPRATTMGQTETDINTLWDPSKNTDLYIHSLVVLLSFLQKLLQAARRHVFCDEYNLWAAGGGGKTVNHKREKKRIEAERKTREDKNSYPRLALLHVQPVLVELYNVWVFDLHQVLKHLLDLLLKKKNIHWKWFTS